MASKKLFHGGTILTMNDDLPRVEAVGAIDEKIVAVGTLEQVKKILGEDHELINLNGGCLLPGFIDCHLHPVGSLFYYVYPELSEVKSIEELKEILKKNAKEKNNDDLILGLNFNEQNFDESKLPTCWDLDDAIPDKPCAILRTDGHLIVANSKALEWAGITTETIPPEGGEIQKDNKGNLTGILTENATNLIMNKLTPPDADTINEATLKFSQDLAKKGITSIHGVIELDTKGGVENLGGVSIPIMKLIKSQFLQNCYFLIYTQTPKKLKRMKKPPLHEDMEDGKYKIGGLKSWFDGTFGSSSALMFENFADQPEKNGFLVINENVLYERMKAAHELGYQIAIHAIGDKANRMIVNMYEKILNESPRPDHRHRIEHASMLTEDVINDMKKLGLIASCQPSFLNSEYTWLEKRLGKERCKHVYPYKSLISAGVLVAAGSDCPVEDPNPILGLHALVTRNGFVPEECIPIEEALKFYTINAAIASFQEHVRGSIEIGKMADLVILDENPLQVPPNEIKNLRVLSTFIRGKRVYKADGDS
ncbi:MAG: amidohydrolase [Promethearchaeota archaeon]